MSNEHQEAVRAMHREVDEWLVELRRRNPDFNPPCKAGCFWCCYEVLIVHEQEVDNIIATMSPEQIEDLKPRLRQWLERAKPYLSMPFNEKIGTRWRRAVNAPCPLLKDGRSVYDERPLGCRVFFAMSHPERCAMPYRPHQLFAEYPHPNGVDVSQLNFAMSVRKLHSEHLGVLLANKLLGTNIKSALDEERELPEGEKLHLVELEQ